MVPVDIEEFARDCVYIGRQCGVDAHYLMAVAMLRSQIQEGAFEDRFGPYGYTEARWNLSVDQLRLAIYPDPLGLNLTHQDIGNSHAQCALFAVTTSLLDSKLLRSLDRPPEPAELYLSSIVGTVMTTVGAEFPDSSIDQLLSQETAAVALDEFLALAPKAFAAVNWQAAVDVTAAELQAAYDKTQYAIANARASTAERDSVLRTVEFLFATDRKRNAAADPELFGCERADSLSFGAVKVNVPDDLNHDIGHLELPSEYCLFGVTLYRENAKPNKHFFIKSTEVFDQDKFGQIVRSGHSHTAIVFVHGFNTSFGQAVLRFAQIVWDMQFKGTPVLYSWPSHGGILNYLYDRESVMTSRSPFIKLLQVLQTEGAIETLHILAHSMGNMIVLDALNQAAKQFSNNHLAEVVFAAPDMSVNAFGQWIPGVRPIARGLTLYASSQDKALLASRKANAGPRAGDIFEDGPIVLSGLDSIDVSSIGAELFGLNHNVFASNRSLIDDIGRIYIDGKRPVSARSPQIRGMPPDSSPPRYWRYPA